jgi:hypothetical protein
VGRSRGWNKIVVNGTGSSNRTKERTVLMKNEREREREREMEEGM